MSKKEIYTGNIAVSLALLIAFRIFKTDYFFIIGASVLALTLLSEKLAKWIAYGFNKIFKLIGYVNSTIILSLFYIFLLTPIAILKRFSFSKKSQKSNWIEVIDNQFKFKELW